MSIWMTTLLLSLLPWLTLWLHWELLTSREPEVTSDAWCPVVEARCPMVELFREERVH